MPELHFILPGDPDTLTGGYIYDKRIIAGLPLLGWSVELHCVDASFPSPSTQALKQAEMILSALPDQALVVIDGLALGGMPELIHRHAHRLTLIALIHHPLAAETGLSTAAQEQLFRAESEALAAVARVIVPSPGTASALAEYGVDKAAIGIVTPGTDPAPLAKGSPEGNGLSLLCVATVTPRKGHPVLIEALAGLRDRNWRLTCVGNLTLSPETVTSLQRSIEIFRLQQRVHFVGEVARKSLASFYDQADLFVLASYLEGYGMALAEALACGLPIVSTTAGAIPETVPEEAALLVPPGDPTALRKTLAEFMDQPKTRQRLARAARAARNTLPDWPTACTRFARELTKAAQQ